MKAKCNVRAKKNERKKEIEDKGKGRRKRSSSWVIIVPNIIQKSERPGK